MEQLGSSQLPPLLRRRHPGLQDHYVSIKREERGLATGYGGRRERGEGDSYGGREGSGGCGEQGEGVGGLGGGWVEGKRGEGLGG